MKSSCTSAITSFALRAAVGDIHTPGPKLQKPFASGGDTGTRNTSGCNVMPAGSSWLRHSPIGR